MDVEQIAYIRKNFSWAYHNKLEVRCVPLILSGGMLNATNISYPCYSFECSEWDISYELPTGTYVDINLDNLKYLIVDGNEVFNSELSTN